MRYSKPPLTFEQQADQLLSLNLSRKLAKRWKMKTLPHLAVERMDPLYRWRLDVLTLGRTRSHVICVNEPTHYAFVLLNVKPFTEQNVLQAFVDRLQEELQRLNFPASRTEGLRNGSIVMGIHTDQSLIGSMNHLKLQYAYLMHVEGWTPASATQSCNLMPIPAMNFANAFQCMERLR